MIDLVRMTERAVAGFRALAGLSEHVRVARARATIVHLRRDANGTLREIHRQTTKNVKTNSGRDFLHVQGYGTSPGANGLNWIGLSNDTLTETTGSTTLSTEIAANGLARAQGTVSHTNGTTTTTVSKTFTCATAPQAVQKAALFSASSSGTMHHVLAFTQRSLQVDDQLTITFTITLD